MGSSTVLIQTPPFLLKAQTAVDAAMGISVLLNKIATITIHVSAMIHNDELIVFLDSCGVGQSPTAAKMAKCDYYFLGMMLAFFIPLAINCLNCQLINVLSTNQHSVDYSLTWLYNISKRHLEVGLNIHTEF